MNLFDDNDIEQDDASAAAETEHAAAEPAHPRAAKICLGHEDVEKSLLEFHAAGRMPHALIFAGPKGIGKATMAFRLARFLLKHGKTDDAQDSLFGAPAPRNFTSLEIPESDPVFARVASGGHGDLLTIERPYDETKDRYKSAVDVEEIRKVAPFLRKTAGEGGWRVAIVDDADTMNRNAQNALLKILEEPPSNAVIILIAHRAGALIPTIRSRSRVIKFDPLPEEIFRDLLARRGHRISGEEFTALNALSEGSVGRALKLLEMDGVKLAARTLDLLSADPADWPSIHAFADMVAGMDEGVETLSEIFQWIYGSMARAKARGGEITGFGVHKGFMRAETARLSTEKILEKADLLRDHFIKCVIGNLDRRQAVLAAFSLISG